MMDAFHRLVFATTMRRAAAIEAWLAQHADHYPGARISIPFDNPFTAEGACSCGATAEFTVLVTLETRAVPKC